MNAISQRAGRLGVGTIGAGRVGTVLAASLAGAGHALTGITAISEHSRERAGALLPGVPILDVPEVVRRSELVLIAVPESELAPLVEGLAAVRAWQPGQLVVHTAPGQGVGVLASATALGAIALAIHPVLDFTGTSIDLARLSGAYFGITAAAPVLPIAMALAVEMGGEPVVIAEADRTKYAQAMRSAASFSSTYVDELCATLASIGVPRPGAFAGNLIRSSVENAISAHDPGEPLVAPQLE